jgi:hypothetical protein
MDRVAKSRLRSAICGVFSFLISMLLFLLTVLAVLQGTLLRQGFLESHMQSADFYSKVSSEIKEQYISYGNASGFDEPFFDSVFVSVITTDQIKQDVNTLVGQMYSNTKLELDTAALNQKLYDAFVKNAESRRFDVTPQVEEQLHFLTDTCITAYEQAVTFPYGSQIGSLLTKAAVPLRAAMIVCGVVVVALALFLYFLNRWKHRAVRYGIYAVTGTLLMTLVLPLLALFSDRIHRIGIESQGMYDFAVSYMTGVVNLFFVAAAVQAVLLGVLSVCYILLKKRVSA